MSSINVIQIVILIRVRQQNQNSCPEDEHINFNSVFCSSRFPRTKIETAIHFYQSNSTDKKVVWKSQSKKSNLMFQIQLNCLPILSQISLPPTPHAYLLSENVPRVSGGARSRGGGGCGIVLMVRVTCPPSYQSGDSWVTVIRPDT